MNDLNAKTTLCCSDKNNDNGDIPDNIMPTHKNFNGKTSSILDYFIISTKLFDYVEDCTVFSDEDMTSDHFPISLKLKLNRNISKKNIYQHFTKFKKYNFEKANWDGFKNALPTAVDSNIGDNVDELEEFIKHSLLKASDQFIPIFTNKANKSKQLPKHILDLIKARKTARKIADKDPDC
jgi:hypothetical protein